MTATQRTLLAAARTGTLFLVTGLFTAAVHGQSNNVKFDSGLTRTPAKPDVPEVKPQPHAAWLRLDPGAVLCRTRDDLDRLAARRHGEVVAGPVDCRVIHDPTAVSIMQRNGSGRTEVRMTTSKGEDTGWTDAWLPPGAPTAATTSASR